MRWMVTVLAVAVLGGWALAQGWAPRGPVYIYGDDQFTWENGVVKGSGTADDPYVIEGWVIDTQGFDYGIFIDGTRAHFVIRNCQIKFPMERAGIMLSNVRNGRIENCSIYGGRIGIHLLVASDVVITKNAIGFCDAGIVLAGGTQRILVYENTIENCGFPAKDEGLNNRWYYEGRGNFWSDYRGTDANGDGIGDTPYEVVPDRYPLMERPVQLPDGARRMGVIDLARVDARGIVTLAPGSLVRLIARDIGVGVDEIFYRLDDGSWLTYTDPFPLPKAAMVRMEYYAVDKLGNREATRTLTIYLDIEPPVTRIVLGDPHYMAPDGKIWFTSRTSIELRAEDASGVANIFYRIVGGDWKPYTSPFTIPGPEGPYKVEYYAIDLFGNREAVQSVVLWKDDTPPTTEPSAYEEGERPFVSPAPSPAPSLTFRITLTQIELVENLGVGENWKLGYLLNGTFTALDPGSLPLLLYRGPAVPLRLTFRVTEGDEVPDLGEQALELSPPWTLGRYQVEVPVYEDNVEDETMALWRFTLDVAEEQ